MRPAQGGVASRGPLRTIIRLTHLESDPCTIPSKTPSFSNRCAKSSGGGVPLLFAPRHHVPVNAYGNETRKSQWSNMSVIRGVPHCRHAYNRSFGSGLRRPDHFKPLVPCFASATHGRFNGMSTLTIPGLQSGNGRRLGDLGT